MSSDLPVADVKPERRLTWAWIVPVLALVLAAGLGYSAWRERGLLIAVTFDDAHGLRAGDAVRYRGMAVGEIRDITLDSGLDGVRMTIALRRDAYALARSGSRFWVVRPEVTLGGVRGLETIVGPRYIAAIPGDDGGTRRLEFVGLPAAPLLANREPADLEIVLEATERGSINVGSPLLYRDVKIGTVIAVALASDGGSVEARVHVEKAYRSLVREGSRFWDSGGVDAEFGLAGFSLEMGSLLDVVHGGVSMATPPPDDAGAAALNGQRFRIGGYDSDFSDWNPTVPLGSELLPDGATMPQPLRAVLAWRSGLVIKRDKSREGRVTPTEWGLLGPADLLTDSPAKRMEDDTLMLEVAGQALVPSSQALKVNGSVAFLEVDLGAPWPVSRMRFITDAEPPEDCILVRDSTSAPLPLSAPRLTAERRGWQIDEAIAIDSSWRGAPIVARSDGALIGILVVDDEGPYIALLPQRSDAE